ncbi:hypothetical protein HDC90_001136 [Pedobacter sp. AK013]|uniref:hypothetical protein n=1 Tax=Pedobacter sp. AK013 TaxID=2723071 RepID=UPI0016169D90|nr:hypothetical protein [Pedobacter sp. AK013]MBB6236524.1 hypothetical protein [Pedobacter sp. AK013]
MKKMFLTALLSVLMVTAFGQKVYQSGAYYGQSIRQGFVLTGTLIEKYGHKGFMWFKMNVKQEMCIVAVSDVEVFRLAKQGEKLVLIDCFAIESSKWKRKENK